MTFTCLSPTTNHISVSPKGKPILQFKQNKHKKQVNVAVDTDVQFGCAHNDIVSKPDIDHFVFSLDGNVQFRNNLSIWDTIFNNINETGSYTCKVENTINSGESSSAIELVVQGKCSHNCMNINHLYLCSFLL